MAVEAHEARTKREGEPMIFRLRQIASRVAVSLPFRILVAVACLTVHLLAITKMAHDRFDWKFDRSPSHAPVYSSPSANEVLPNWDRLVVARWDAQHYEGLALRGYSMCKDREHLAAGEHPDDDKRCELDFFPTYGWIGRAVMFVTHLPVDYALFAASVAASFAFLLMWTSRAMTEALGIWRTYLALLLFNAFTSGFTLVTVQTEPCLLALTLGAFLSLHRRWLLVGAILAGAATAIRVSGVATGFAYCAAIAVLTLEEHPRPCRAWIPRAALLPLSGWGIMALLGYYHHRFGDALIYAHAHERAFHYSVSLARVFIPDGRLVMQSIWAEPYEGLILGAALLWFALGHRKGLAGFPREGKAFWYVLFFGVVGVSIYGSAGCAYCGNSRYMLTALPIFFAMAAIMSRKPVVLALWLLMSSMHYYDGSLCFYVSQNHPERIERCSFPRHYRSWDIVEGKE